MDRLTLTFQKTKKQKNLNNKPGTEKEHAAEGVGCSECTREGGRSKVLISTRTLVNKDWKGIWANRGRVITHCTREGGRGKEQISTCTFSK
jgi:hypothetical protein